MGLYSKTFYCAKTCLGIRGLCGIADISSTRKSQHDLYRQKASAFVHGKVFLQFNLLTWVRNLPLAYSIKNGFALVSLPYSQIRLACKGLPGTNTLAFILRRVSSPSYYKNEIKSMSQPSN
jgi:hypothetical protein